jgi:hypothetical protein
MTALLSVVVPVADTFSQNVEIGATVGAANYIGDLAPTPVISETKGAGGVFARINFSSTWAWTNSLMFAQVSGNDKNFSFNEYRNLNFKSNIYEYASVIEFNYLKYGVGVLDNKFTSYLFAGIGIFGFNPQGYYNGQWYNLRDFQTEGPENKYQPYSVAIPFGIGIKWRLNRNMSFEWQFGFRKTYTDYLDDVSKTYPDMNAQLQKGQVAAMVTDPSSLLNEGISTNKSGLRRGNPDFNDWYMITGISLSYRIYGRIKCARFY